MAEGAAAAAQAKERRKEQLRQWARSCTNQEPAEPRWQRRRRRRRRVGDGDEEEDEGDRGSQGEGDGRAVRFERSAEFLAACAAGDLLEAEDMLTRDSGKEVIDSTNTDGISALHQACIDENLEVVEFLVNHGANVNQADNEGWTPLHVAASCGYMEIAEYLLKHSANIAAVNSDGDVPLDIAEDDCMENLLRAEIAKGGVDIEAAKREEEEVMLRDSRQWLNAGKIEDIRHSKTGASALHVAAAKGYIEVMRLLLQANFDPNARDKDGWTPLHAAAHWGVEEACRLLVEHFCDMNALNSVGQRPCDVADEDVLSLLEELRKKQEDLRNEKEANKRAVIDTNMEQHPSYTNKHRRSSVCRMSSKEKISVQDQSKERKTLGTISVGEEETISSSEEETEDGEASEPGNNTQVNENGLLPDTHNSAVSSVSSEQKFTGAPSSVSEKSELPLSSLRAGLRKTGSYGVLQDAKLAGSSVKDLGIKRSASSPRLDTQERNKEPLMARVQPTPGRRIFSSPESAQDGKKEDTEGGLQMKLDMVPTTQLHTNTSSSMVATSSTSSSGTGSSTDSQDKRRSYQTPVRDEESESQRKARSRLMRQSRRSTQGVTLTDLKEAEKTLGKPADSPSSTEPKTAAEDRGEKAQSLESVDITRRLGLPSTEQNMSASPINTVNSPSNKEIESTSKEETEAESQNHLTARDRRKWRKDQRLALGTNSYAGMENEETESLNHNETAGHGVTQSWSSFLPHRTGSHTFQRHSSNFSSKEESEKDYKKLYENLLADNETLRDQLQETELKLTQIRLELERVTQRQERSAERPALLELERFERRSLERKVAELEEELKVLSDLKADNQRLKDENAALIRVISKLSK
eukprot:XP_017950970.1 PREDICTED: protein phosphatase 1 regulatory subunit 12C isoform X1 [Xenopus tropicalis]